MSHKQLQTGVFRSAQIHEHKDTKQDQTTLFDGLIRRKQAVAVHLP